MKKIFGILGLAMVLQTANVQAQGILGIGENWDTKKKSAVIGGAIGAGAGVLLSKDKKLQGGAIGALLGVGAGYLYGRHKEKKQAEQQNVIYQPVRYYQVDKPARNYQQQPAVKYYK